MNVQGLATAARGPNGTIKYIRDKIPGAAILLVLFFAIGTPVHANLNIAPISVNFGNQTIGTSSAPDQNDVDERYKTQDLDRKHFVIRGSIFLFLAFFAFHIEPGPEIDGQRHVHACRIANIQWHAYVHSGKWSECCGFADRHGRSSSAVSYHSASQPRRSTAGQTASFSASASGVTPLGYQWKKNGAAINGATSAAYTTPPTTTSDNGAQFTVTVSTSTGSASSNPATLTVIAAAVAPAITTQPVSRTVTAGQAASFSVAATGTAPLSYQWMKGGTPIAGATSATYSDSGYNHSRQRLTVLLLPSAIRQVM